MKVGLSALFVGICFSFVAISANAQSPEAKLKQMGIVLKTPAKPVANFVSVVRTGNLLFLSGAGPKKADGTFMIGKIGESMTIEEGHEAARLTGIALLEVLKAELGDLNKVKRIVKVLGMVNATSNFTQQPQVMNGFSDFMVQVFGEKGKHARSAVGVASLPSGIPVEIEIIVEVN
jgi:enamine deaminase RidA (YjgF/YER057c/UK114 family)